MALQRCLDVIIVSLGVPWDSSGNRLDWTRDQIMFESGCDNVVIIALRVNWIGLGGVCDKTGGGLMFKPSVLQ